MKLKPRYQRMLWLLLAGCVFVSAAFYIIVQFRENLQFFYTPSDLTGKNIKEESLIRIGGLVKEGSIHKDEKKLVTIFILTDGGADIEIVYLGILPPMFRENQGIVAKGQLKQGKFEAEELLTKHDENYMPREVAKKLKEKGLWKEPSSQ